MVKDIQELIPQTHRDLVEAVPRGFAKSAVTGALLIGAAGGALLAIVVPDWMAAAVFTALYIGHKIWVALSDRSYDRKIAELEARDLEWKDDATR
ncbi:MAG: hypothetical protein AAGG48_07120 [Planctomycetota bacterium]